MTTKHVLQYVADYTGCGHWRMLFPAHLLHMRKQLQVTNTSTFIKDPDFYKGLSALRMQRQSKEIQLEFFTWVHALKQKMGFKMIYEVDDIIFPEDIPTYIEEPSPQDDITRTCIKELMLLCDEVTVSTGFLKEYYESKVGHTNIRVLQNYIPNFWWGYYYDRSYLEKNFDLHQKRPRILYAGSASHIDQEGKGKDDFSHIVEAIRSTADQYQWVFVAAIPPGLDDLLQEGKVEFHPWVTLDRYPLFVASLQVNLMIAPLQNIPFNEARSDLKILEAGAMGVPIICQDMLTYRDAILKFQSGNELLEKIKEVLGDREHYFSLSDWGRQYVKPRWLELEENIGQYLELFAGPNLT